MTVYKEPKVSVLQANAKLFQKDSIGLGINIHWGNILSLNFLFSCNKASDANIGIIAILVYFDKTLLVKLPSVAFGKSFAKFGALETSF